VAGKFLELDTLGRRECSPLGELGSGEPGMERDWGVLEVDNLGVLGVELTRDNVFGRLRFCWTSCMEVKPDCCWRRLLDDEGGIL
jgi:hypothetical protein